MKFGLLVATVALALTVSGTDAANLRQLSPVSNKLADAPVKVRMEAHKAAQTRMEGHKTRQAKMEAYKATQSKMEGHKATQARMEGY